MKNWKRFLLGGLGLIGMTFAHETVVKVMYTRPVEEVVYIDEAPKKRVYRKLASQEKVVPSLLSIPAPSKTQDSSSSSNSSSHVPDAPIEMDRPETSSFASIPASDYSMEFTNQDSYNSSGASRSPSKSVTSTGKNSQASSSGSARTGGAFAFSIPGLASTKPATTSATDSTNSKSSGDSGSSSPSTTYTDFTETFTFTDDDAPNYAFDPAKVQIAGDNLSLVMGEQNIVDALLADFSGQLIGLEYSTLSDGSQGLTTGIGDSCDSQTKNCAEFDISWIPQPSELMRIWHFNETTAGQAPGGLDFTDSSGNGGHGSRVNTPQFNTWGRMQGSLRNPPTAQGGANLPVNLSVTNKVSISFWYNNTASPVGPGGSNLILEYTPDFNFNSGFYFAANDCSNVNVGCNNLVFAGHSSTPAGYNLVEGAPLNLGWQHLVIIYDRSVTPNVYKVYRNGVLRTTTQVAAFTVSSSEAFANSNLYLFGRAGASFGGKGDIDELAVWKSVLTEEEIKLIYDRQSAAFGRGSSLGIYVSDVKDALIPTQWDEFQWTSPSPFGKQRLLNDDNSYSLASGNLSNGLIAHWKFDEPSGTTGSNSLSEPISLHHGTPGTGVTMGQEGKHQSGAALNGTVNAYAILANPSTLNIRTSDWSVGAWMKSTKTGMQFIAAKSRYGSAQGRWALGTGLSAPGKLSFMIDIGAGGVVTECTAGPTVTDGRWRHVMATLDRDGLLKLYIDGVLCNSSDISSSAAQDWNTGYIAIIGNYNDVAGSGILNSPVAGFDGLIDEVYIWNRVLTDGSASSAEEVQDLYRRGIARIRHQVRFCNDNLCDGESWMGPDGTADSFFSELNNSTVSAPSLTFGSPQTTRYIQYRSVLETDSTLDAYQPELNSVTLPKDGYESEGAGVVTDGVPYQTITSFSETIGGGGCTGGVRYQLSNSPIGPWYYWNNTTWTLASSQSDTNTVSELNDPIALSMHHTQFGAGTLYVNVLLMSDGVTSCALEAFEVHGLK